MSAVGPATDVRLRLTITLLEDLHSGTGAGRGAEVDAAQARDRRGRPVVRSTHLRGLLRAAGEELVRFGAASPDDVLRLFGGEGRQRGALRLTSLRWPRDEGTKSDRDGHDRFLTWGSTARERGQRAPLEDTLRTVEHVKSGTELQADLLVPTDLVGLLRECIAHTDRLGGGRTRGAGLIQTATTPCPAPAAPAGAVPPRGMSTSLRLALRCLEPVCLPVTGHPGNVIPTECFVRGATLRGALVRWLLDRGAQEAAEAVLTTARVSDALPVPDGTDEVMAVEHGEVVPMPLHLGTPKVTSRMGADVPWWAGPRAGPELGACGEAARWRAGAPDSSAAADAGRPGPLKRPGPREHLYREKGGSWRRFEPHVDLHLRNRVPVAGAQGGRAEAALFAVEELAEETLLLATLDLDPEAAGQVEAALRPLLDATSWLGVGRGARPVEVAAARWLPAQTDQAAGADRPVGGALTVTLLSDLLARGPSLGFFDALTPEVLASLAGQEPRGSPQHERFDDVVEVRGFNATSGLPTPPALALRRGSTLRVEGPAADQLRAALRGVAALGERTHDGFGRFALDLALDLAAVPSSRAGRADGAGRPASVPDLETVVRAAESLAARIDKRGPSRQQWQQLRLAARTAATDADLPRVLEAFKARGSTSGGARWENAGLVDLAKELERLAKTLAKGPKELDGLGRQLVDAFVRRVCLKVSR